MLRSPGTLSHAARTLVNTLVLNTLVCREDVTADFAPAGGDGVMVAYLVQWLEQLDVLRGRRGAA